MKAESISQLYSFLPEDQRVLVDVLRQIVRENLPLSCREKLSFGVPFFYGRRGICIIWPAAVPRGGIREGVLLGFWQGNKLKDPDQYLKKGTNKKVFYKIYRQPEEINEKAIVRLLKEALAYDQQQKIRG